MITYPVVGAGTTWVPVSGGSAAETKYTLMRGTEQIAVLPVRASCSNEVTKAGMARSLIKLESYLDATMMRESWNGGDGAVGASASATKLTPISVHLVASAPRGAMQLAGTTTDSLNGLLSFLLANLLTILTGRSSDQSVTAATAWPSASVLDALKGLSLFNAISGTYGAAS